MKWGLVAKAGIPHVRKEALWICRHLEALGEEVFLEHSLASAEAGHKGAGMDLRQLDAEVDLFLTVGGDGTILMTLQETDKPILGVNAGAIGFLTEVEPPQAQDALQRVLAGDYQVEERDRLAVRLDGQRLPDATNEVTLQTSRIAKLIQFRITVDDEVLDTLRGDGIIVSTPTGSTGYAMSVGGPLMHPRVPGTILAPIAPFRLSARPWVVPQSSQIELKVLDRDSAPDIPQARVVVDGQHGFEVDDDTQILIGAAERKARFVRLGPGFYERVRTKLVR